MQEDSDGEIVVPEDPPNSPQPAAVEQPQPKIKPCSPQTSTSDAYR